MLVMAAVSVSAATASAPRPLSLGEAVALAQRNAPEFIQAEGQKRAGDAQVRAALAAFLPSVSLSAGAARQVPSAGGRTRIENGQIITLPAEPWSFNLGLGTSLQLSDVGRRCFDLRLAQARASAAEVNEVSSRYAVTLAVKQQFFDVLAARESEAAARAQLEQAEYQLRSSIARLRSKSATRSDSLRSEIQRRNARLALIEARNALELANASLTRAVGSDDPITAAAADSLAPAGLALDDESIRQLAAEGPAVRQGRMALDAARAARRGVWTDFLPAVAASYSRSGNAPGASFALGSSDYSYSGALRLSLSFPLFNQFQREAELTQAQVAEQNAAAAVRDTRLAALEGATQWLGAFHSAEERVGSQAATVAAAEEDLRVQQQRYAVGASTLLDLLTSQAQLDQGRRDLIRARYDVRVAKAQIEALVGRDLGGVRESVVAECDAAPRRPAGGDVPARRRPGGRRGAPAPGSGAARRGRSVGPGRAGPAP